MLRTAGGAVARGVSVRAAAVHSRLLVVSSSDSSAESTAAAQAPAVSLRFASNHTASAGLCARRASPGTALATRALSGAQHRVEGADVVPFNLADIGEGITEVEIIQWFVKVGDQIKAFDRVCEVQSDKATVEISSRYDGEVVKVHTDTGGIAHVGKPLIDLRRPAAAGRASAASGAPEAGATPTSAPPAPTPMTAPADAARDPAHSQSLATPAVRAIAKAHSIDIATVQGSGKNGRVMKEDMLRVLGGQRFDHVTLDPPVTGPVPPAEFAQRANGGHKAGGGVTPGATAAGAQASTRPAEAGAAGPGADTFVPVRGYMRAMIKTMQAQTSVPHLVFSEEYSMDVLIELKRKFQAESPGVKLTYMPFLIKALSIALSDNPELNATLSLDLEHVIQRAAHNVGIAVDSPNGLVVPNIKRVETLSITEIARELARLAELARGNKLPPQDLAGGSITLSNIGAIGGTYMSPVLVPGEAVIGAMGAVRKVPRYAPDGSLQPQMVMQVSWAADHRLLGGAAVARFSNRFKALVEDPAMMLVAMR